MAAPKKGKTSRRTMTAPLKAELGQVNFYSIKKADEKKKKAGKKIAAQTKRK